MKTINELNRLYPYPRPRPTVQIILLGLIVASGLIALFFAAFHAFKLVAEPTQAFFAALVIEAGLIAECLAIINKPRSVAPWLGLVISYVVSGTYNYTQAAKAGEGLGGWELGALAFGPLSALNSSLSHHPPHHPDHHPNQPQQKRRCGPGCSKPAGASVGGQGYGGVGQGGHFNTSVVASVNLINASDFHRL